MFALPLCYEYAVFQTLVSKMQQSFQSLWKIDKSWQGWPKLSKHTCTLMKAKIETFFWVNIYKLLSEFLVNEGNNSHTNTNLYYITISLHTIIIYILFLYLMVICKASSDMFRKTHNLKNLNNDRNTYIAKLILLSKSFHHPSTVSSNY